jgi:hypothetical protein
MNRSDQSTTGSIEEYLVESRMNYTVLQVISPGSSEHTVDCGRMVASTLHAEYIS